MKLTVIFPIVRKTLTRGLLVAVAGATVLSSFGSVGVAEAKLRAHVDREGAQVCREQFQTCTDEVRSDYAVCTDRARAIVKEHGGSYGKLRVVCYELRQEQMQVCKDSWAACYYTE